MYLKIKLFNILTLSFIMFISLFSFQIQAADEIYRIKQEFETNQNKYNIEYKTKTTKLYKKYKFELQKLARKYSRTKNKTSLKMVRKELASLNDRKNSLTCNLFSSDEKNYNNKYSEKINIHHKQKYVEIFKHINFRGSSQKLGIPGKYKARDITIGNDNLSSLRVPKGARVILYEHNNFQGRSRTYKKGNHKFIHDFNDLTSSIKVMKD